VQAAIVFGLGGGHERPILSENRPASNGATEARRVRQCAAPPRYCRRVNRPPRRAAAPLLAGILSVLAAAPARADIPPGYKGKPFDPAVAGGKGIIPATVKAGPYAIPGRLDLINYDLGGVGVAYDCIHHEVKGGDGYRTDVPTASLSLTAASKMDVWYGAGAPLDGTRYPSATSEDFYVGALDSGDWFNYTVDVATAGTYALSSTWATGNGPPGGMGGDGSMGLAISVNGVKIADWSATFPDWQTKATYHNWKPYPSFATLTLDAGLQVIKLQLTSSHLNLDYLEFELVGADGGAGGGDASNSADGGAGATGGAGDGGAVAGGGGAGTGAATAGAGGGAPSTGGGGGGGTSGAAGAVAGNTAGSSGGAGAVGPKAAHGSGGCAVAASPRGLDLTLLVAGAIVAATGWSRRRRRQG
jgi:hypothetical protein